MISIKEPYILVQLVDGTNTWVTYVGVKQFDHVGVINSAGEAFAWFIVSLSENEEALDRHMKPFGVSAWQVDSSGA